MRKWIVRTATTVGGAVALLVATGAPRTFR